MQTWAAFAMEWIIVVFIGLLALIILYKIWLGTIDLTGLLNEAASGPGSAPVGGPGNPPAGGPGNPPTSGGGKASMSRLQLLLFTFIIAGLYLTLCFEAGEMIAIPNQVLGILGISGGSYVVSKGIQKSQS
jgi:hypothetical protein